MTLSQAFTEATALRGLGGGLLIGLSAALLLLGNGRIAGVSSIAARAAGIADGSMPRGSAIAFILGLPIGTGLLMALGLVSVPTFPSLPILLAAGLLVGFGTRLGNGCTSGHGVCGMSRLSPRSLAATATFIGAGVLTVAIVHALGS